MSSRIEFYSRWALDACNDLLSVTPECPSPIIQSAFEQFVSDLIVNASRHIQFTDEPLIEFVKRVTVGLSLLGSDNSSENRIEITRKDADTIIAMVTAATHMATLCKRLSESASQNKSGAQSQRATVFTNDTFIKLSRQMKQFTAPQLLKTIETFALRDGITVDVANEYKLLQLGQGLNTADDETSDQLDDAASSNEAEETAVPGDEHDVTAAVEDIDEDEIDNELEDSVEEEHEDEVEVELEDSVEEEREAEDDDGDGEDKGEDSDVTVNDDAVNNSDAGVSSDMIAAFIADAKAIAAAEYPDAEDSDGDDSETEPEPKPQRSHEAKRAATNDSDSAVKRPRGATTIKKRTKSRMTYNV